MPLTPGAGDEEYLQVFDEIIVPKLIEFHPELILLSAGFDAHEADPLASMEVTTAGIRRNGAARQGAGGSALRRSAGSRAGRGLQSRNLAQCVEEVIRVFDATSESKEIPS